MNVLITGAAGNLGGLLARYLRDDPSIDLFLMIHNKDVSQELKNDPRVRVIRADLAREETLRPALEGVHTVVHFAGVLFRHGPEKFLPVTNGLYFRNLLDSAIRSGVKKVILISFPHVEGESFPGKPARGSLDGNPISAHARTRLEEEKYLFSTNAKGFAPVSLRVGMVYGRGVLMIDAARWLSKQRLLGVWKKPTWIHLISKDDFLSTVKSAVEKPNVSGIYHVGDEGTQTLQEFLDAAARHWGHARPWRMPEWMIFCAAACCEAISFLFRVRSPLTRDFIRIGMASYYGDTSRMRKELLKELKYGNFREGLSIL